MWIVRGILELSVNLPSDYMKTSSFTISVILLLLNVGFSNAQNDRLGNTVLVGNSAVHAENPKAVSPAYFTRVSPGDAACISPAEEAEAIVQIRKNIAMLRERDPNACKTTAMVHPLFIWPVQHSSAFVDYGFYTVNYLVDQNPVPNGNLLDYNCGARTYDQATSNHRGTDIILWPYAWKKMDDQVMEVIAAAPGVIVSKIDGSFDRNCANNGAGVANAIHVRHADGSIAWYWHFKSGSLTQKGIGDSVALGEYLGTAGSSGSSDWPHLHFQVMDSTFNLIDPWDGPCNATNPGASWWQTQQPYTVPSVNRICTKGTLYDMYNCPDPEITYEKDTFNIGDTLAVWVYTRDLELNSVMQLNIYDPTGANALNWSFTVPWNTIATSYVRWYYIVDPWWTQGTWTFESVYGGNVYQHQFYMTHSATGLSDANDELSFSMAPNPVPDKLKIYGVSLEKGDKIQLLDAPGKVVYSKSMEELTTDFTIETAGFSNGCYAVQLIKSGNSFVKKLIIQH